MIKEIEKIESDIKAREEKEKQETGFNTLSTLAELEVIKIFKKQKCNDGGKNELR